MDASNPYSIAADLRENVDDEELYSIAGLTPIGPATRQLRDIALAECARRAEIRINREEYGGLHDASWNNSRQTEAQWLSEMGVEE